MFSRSAIVIAIAASLGWVVPLFLAVRFLLDWCRLEASPTVYGYERGTNSFPFLDKAEYMWTTAAMWAAASAAMWLSVGLWFVVRANRNAEPSAAPDRGRKAGPGR